MVRRWRWGCETPWLPLHRISSNRSTQILAAREIRKSTIHSLLTFFTYKGERAQLRKCDPLSPSRARAGALDLSRPSLCPRRAQELRRPPHETRRGLPCSTSRSRSTRQRQGGPGEKVVESPLFAHSSSGIGGLLVEGGRGLRARDRRPTPSRPVVDVAHQSPSRSPP